MLVVGINQQAAVHALALRVTLPELGLRVQLQITHLGC